MSFLRAEEVGAGTSCVSGQQVISPGRCAPSRGPGAGPVLLFPAGFREREGKDREARTLLRAFELVVSPWDAVSARVPPGRALSAAPEAASGSGCP